MPDVTGGKRKRPPTFQHLPEIRAKKLKRSWVDTAKLKSRWSAEKRREGFIPAVAKDADDHDDSEDNDSDEDDTERSSSNHNRTGPHADHGASKKQRPAPHVMASDDADDAKEREKEFASRERGPRFDWSGGREERGNRGGKSTARSRAFDRQEAIGQQSSGGLGRGQGRGRGRGGRRAQPDMRKRMDHLLDKIKRDYA